MGRKLPSTPRSRVRSALRQVWLRSRERAAALKREGNRCEECGRKASAAKGQAFKVECHHRDGVEWEKIMDYIYRHLLVDPARLECLCPECHAARHEEET